MNTVILTSGPRGVGKSTYVEYVKRLHPEVKVVSRDKLLMDLFGETSLSPYDGGHDYVQMLLRFHLKHLLKKKTKSDSKIIFDCWNGSAGDRQSLINLLYQYGADRVICWQFVVPIDVCVKWFFKKKDSRGYSNHAVSSDYKLYYKRAENIEEDGFDFIRRINPLQLTIPGFPLV